MKKMQMSMFEIKKEDASPLEIMRIEPNVYLADGMATVCCMMGRWENDEDDEEETNDHRQHVEEASNAGVQRRKNLKEVNGE